MLTCSHDAGEGQAVGKAFLLDDVIETLLRDGKSFQERTMHYSVGEETDLYKLLHTAKPTDEEVHG